MGIEKKLVRKGKCTIQRKTYRFGKKQCIKDRIKTTRIFKRTFMRTRIELDRGMGQKK